VTEDISLRRERDISAVISDGFALLFPNWSTLARTVTPAVLVNIAASLIVFGVAGDEEVAQAVLLATLPFQILAYQLVSAAVIAHLLSRDQGRNLDSGDALDVAQDRFGDVVGASVRAVGISVLLAMTVVGLPWAIKRGIKWAFIVQSIIVDGQPGEPSLKYSEALVQGRWWNTFGRLLTAGLILLLPAVILSSLVQLAIPGVIGVILSHATDFLTLPYGMITTTLIFFDLKLRKARE
jgi:hypothetical protein